jgi:hypothetical protein
MVYANLIKTLRKSIKTQTLQISNKKTIQKIKDISNFSNHTKQHSKIRKEQKNEADKETSNSNWSSNK